MGLLSPWHLLVILIVVLMVFGPGKIPEAGKAFGKALGEFKRGANANFDEDKDSDTDK